MGNPSGNASGSNYRSPQLFDVLHVTASLSEDNALRLELPWTEYEHSLILILSTVSIAEIKRTLHPEISAKRPFLLCVHKHSRIILLKQKSLSAVKNKYEHPKYAYIPRRMVMKKRSDAINTDGNEKNEFL